MDGHLGERVEVYYGLHQQVAGTASMVNESVMLLWSEWPVVLPAERSNY